MTTQPAETSSLFELLKHAPPRKSGPWWRRFVTSVIRVGTAAYVGLCVVLTLGQSRLVYHPSTHMEGTPKDIGLVYEEVRFQADDGIDLIGWHVPAENARGTILICHGNAGNISHRLETIYSLRQLGLDVFIFDYRGYGLSEGRPSEKGTYRDADAAWQYLTETRGVSPERIVVFGRSLGGAIAAHLAATRPTAALVVESTFSSAADVGRHYYPFLPVRWLIRFDYNTAEYIGSVRCPVLVIHSVADSIVPYTLGRRVFEAANEPKAFLRISGGHNEAFHLNTPACLEAIAEVIGDVLKVGE